MPQPFQFLNPGPLTDDDLELVLVHQYPGDPANARVPGYDFEMRQRPSGVVMGRIRLRIGEVDGILKYAGHVGYDVDEAFRGRRYAARSLRLLCPFARAHGLGELWIGCEPGNLASRRTCELAGATFRDVLDIPETHAMRQHGWRQARRYAIVL